MVHKTKVNKKKRKQKVHIKSKAHKKPQRKEHKIGLNKLFSGLFKSKRMHKTTAQKKPRQKTHEKQIKEQREHIKKIIEKTRDIKKAKKKDWVKVGIPGFDDLLEKGIPKGVSVIVAGGPGSGKTIFGLQTLNYGASNGEKCLYMTFEESEKRLRQHMHDFGWNPEKLEKEGKLVIKRYDPFAITRQVEALLEKAKGELLIDVKPVLFPGNFKPDRVILDSLSAISAAFVGKEETYRIYIEQLFRLFEELGATSFLITESTQIPVKITESGVEEFLADGVVIIYNLQRGNIRERAIEVLKLRGAQHQKKIVAMEINSETGITVYPEQEIFGIGEGK